MARATLQLVPFNAAVLALVELVFSLLLFHVLLSPPYTTDLLVEQATDLSRSGARLAAVLAFLTGAITVLVWTWRHSSFGPRTGIFSPAAIGSFIGVPLFLLVIGTSFPTTGIVRIRWTGGVAIWLAASIFVRLLFGIAMQHARSRRRILVIGHPERVSAMVERTRCHRGRRFELVEASPTAVSWTMIRHLRISGVVLAADVRQALPEALLDCKLRGVKVMTDQAFQERHLGRLDLNTLTINELLLSEGFANGPLSAACKRLCDISLATALLLTMLPLMALTALAIKIDTRGPVFYRQVRVGAFGRPFTIFKFRSMSVDAEIGGAPRWAQKQDPRITWVGALIRATRIDELAQLGNIIRGDMSLVGPRPERPHFVEELTRAIPFYHERSYVKPGLTGWAQVNFPYGASIGDAREKLSYDLYYVKNRSFLLDLRILVATVRVVLTREGAR